MTVGAFVRWRELAAPVPLQTAAETATAAATAAMTPIRSDVLRVATAITLDKEEQVRRILIVFFGLGLVAVAAAVAVASTGGVPNNRKAPLKGEPAHQSH